MLKINKISQLNNKDTIVLLCNKKFSFKGYGLTDEEIKYVKEEVEKNNKTFVAINQLSRFVLIQCVEIKKEAYLTIEAIRKSGATVQAHLTGNKIKKITIVDTLNKSSKTLAFIEGLALANYQFLKYKKEKDKETFSLNAVEVIAKSVKQEQLNELNCVVEGVCLARTLVNEPVNFLTATQLSKEFQKMGKDAGFKVEVFTKDKIKNLKMGGLLAVNLGSQEPPTFSIMEYKSPKAKNKKPIVFVGKGVVFDTGGLSLKPTANSMDYMKSDMAGAAAVGGAMYAIAKAKLPVHVIALVPATDNRPGENAYVPSDIITMYDGTTVEMMNADAEGRMILADALAYAKKYEPQLVIDLATLTGSAIAAIGTGAMVGMGTADERTKNKLKQSGYNVHERIAEFPFWDDYDEQIKSDIADVKSIGGPYAGSITAGKFLAKFIDYPWMHLDIAGPSFLHTKDSYRGKGGTGVGVRLLFDFLKNSK